MATTAAVSRSQVARNTLRGAVATALLFGGATLGLALADDRVLLVDIVLTYYAVTILVAWVAGIRAASVSAAFAPVATVLLFGAGTPDTLGGPQVTAIQFTAFTLLVGLTIYLIPRWFTRADQYRRIAEELRERTETLQALFDASPLAIITLAPDLTITSWNSAAERIFGWSASEAIGRRLRSLPEGADDELATHRRFSKPDVQFYSVEGRRQRKNGTWIDISVSMAPVYDKDGRHSGEIAIAADVTERKQAEAAVRESEERFRLMANTMPAMVGVTDAAGNAYFFNQAWLEFTGSTAADEAGPGWLAHIHPDDREEVARELAQALERRESRQLEYRAQRKDGEYRWILAASVPQFGEDGELRGYIGTGIDITERRNAEQALQQSEEKARAIVKAIPDILLRVDAEGKILDISGEHGSGLVTPPERLIGTSLQAILGDDFRRAREIIRDALETGEMQSSEFLRQSADGLQSFETRVTPSGANEVVVIARDITQRVLAERARLFQLHILAQVQDAIVAVDRDRKVTLWNEAAERRYGCTSAEAIGRPYHELFNTAWPDEARREDARLQLREDREWHGEVVHHTRDGREIPIDATLRALVDADGQRNGYVAVMRDVTELRQAASAVRERDERLRSFVASAPIILFGTDAQGMITIVAGKGLGGVSVPEDAEVGRNVFEVFSYDPIVSQNVRRALRGEAFDEIVTFGDQSFEVHFSPMHGEDGALSGTMAVAINVTERVQAERALRETEALYSLIVEQAPIGIAATNAEGQVTLSNRTIREIFGAPDEDSAKLLNALTTPAAIKGGFRDLFRDAIDRKVTATTEMTYTSSFGRQADIAAQIVPLFNEEGAVAGAIAIVDDISERLRAERQIRQSEASYRRLIETANEGIWTIDTNGRTTYVNLRMAEMLGYTTAEMSGRPMQDFLDPTGREHATAQLRTGRRNGSEDHDFRFLRKDGSEMWGLVATSTILDDDGDFAGALGMVTDVTDRRRAEDALRRESEFRARVMESTTNGIAAIDLDGNMTLLNNRFLAMTGYAESELRGKHYSMLFDGAAHEKILAHYNGLTSGSEPGVGLEVEMTRKDGSKLLIYHSASAIRHNGDVVGIVGTADDITDRKRLEAQYLQAQKMESIGRLAGGVAHDFSNMMTAIIVNAELDLMTPPSSAVLQEDLREIRETAERAAALAQQLLAFSRRQVIEPKILDINDVVRSTERMLRRLVDERIAMEVRLGDAGTVRVDPHQFEQVLVNLLINARDAMPAGGSILIETERRKAGPQDLGGAEPPPSGEYVVLAVTDTGSGMTPEVRESVFEPFFTTKDVGKGTGLGLATCYGIVKQAGGQILVESEPGRGSRFTIYLPAVAGDAPEPAEEAPFENGLPSGTETVLLVEDEPSLRRLTKRLLSGLGYNVLEAAHGDDALDVSAGCEGSIGLILTDVVMPRMDGPELVRRMADVRPDARVLYMSGYTDSAIVRNSLMERKIDLLQKPFSPGALARKVREVLDR